MTTLLPAHKITPPEWMRDQDLILILDTLNHDDINARMVGGCIRNHYTNKSIYDIDIACKLTPDKSIEILKKQGIKTIPTGIEHGTITAHINDNNFEITTLRHDIKTDGRHAKVTFTTDWTEDAKRRDFTMNALYADRDGSIYDPTSTGLNDIQNHIVRFIGDADIRIQEDYLRILRFMRFYAEFHIGDPDKQSLSACIKHKDKISTLSDERIEDELNKILSKDSAPRAIKLIENHQILPIPIGTSTILSNLIELQNQLNLSNIYTRKYILINTKKHIKNKSILNYINKLYELKKTWDGNIKHALYMYGREVTTQGLLILKAEGHDITDIQISDAINTPVPQLPITATDIMQHFKIGEGREVGKKLKQAEAIWIESNFTLKHNQILEKMD